MHWGTILHRCAVLFGCSPLEVGHGARLRGSDGTAVLRNVVPGLQGAEQGEEGHVEEVTADVVRPCKLLQGRVWFQQLKDLWAQARRRLLYHHRP